MKKHNFINIMAVIALISFMNKGFAQQQTTTTKHVTREDSAAFNALVMYPDSIRLDIFEVCEYPAAVVNIASLQKNTSSGFSDAISGYSKEEQEDFWNLSRYPGLISDLAQGGKKSKEDIDKILVNYPEEIHETALKYGMNQYDMLKKLDDMQTQTNTQFDQILAEYPPVTQQAIKVLTQYPEIISLLNDHLSLTVRIGDHFRRDSVGVIHRMDSLNLAEVRQNAEDAAAWKQSVQQDPQEASDLKSAATDYAKSNGYTQEEINTAPSPEYVATYTCQPYSYWFGYPSWYPYSYWYPYPYWYDCGFYYDPYGNLVYIGYPSYYFTNWYFYNPEHMYQYPYLCNSYVDYYYGRGAGHRTMADANSVIVHHWVNDNKAYLPKDFTTNKTNRIEAIKQVGQLNADVKKELNGKPVTSAARDLYLQKNASKYPALNAMPQTKTASEIKQQNTPEVIQQPAKQPAVKIPKSVQKSTVSPKQYSTQSSNNFNNMNRAQQYHRQQWEQTQPSTQQQYQPVQHSQPQEQPARSEPVQQQPKSYSPPSKNK
jgi:hypothetical protein